jgi:hypothetical protein
MPRLQDERDRIHSAMTEGMVAATITLYNSGCIDHEPDLARHDLEGLLRKILKLDEADIKRWLDEYGIS